MEDSLEYQLDTAKSNYCQLYGKEESQLNEEDHRQIERMAGTHIGFFLTWLIEQQAFYHQMAAVDLNKIRAVEKRELLGVDLLIEELDGTLTLDDVKSDFQDFVSDYYTSRYLQDYGMWVSSQLGDLPLEFVGSWEDYDAIKPMLDQAYQSYLNKKRGFFSRLLASFFKSKGRV